MNKDDLTKVLRFIEENMRVTEQTSIEYLDVQGVMGRLKIKQNHIIFGRRGSGKSLLLKSLRDDSEVECISVNLEDFKDISFPNSIIQVQKAIIKKLLPNVASRYPWYSANSIKKTFPLKRRLLKQIKSLNHHLAHPDLYDQEVKEKSSRKGTAKAKKKAFGGEGEGTYEASKETELSKQLRIDKLDILKNDLSNIKELFSDVAEHIGKDIFLILDDFYFIRKDEQPYFIDFFHRVSKNIPLYLKVATIQHRSKLYIQDQNYVGVELPHDAQPIHLDYSLQDFDRLVSFKRELLAHINQKAGVDIDYNSLITENAFRFLCLASGGVPRDFFSLLVSLEPIFGGDRSVSKPNVIEKAIENVRNKMDSLKKDASDEDILLENYLQIIRSEIIDKRRWNAFLLSNSEVHKYPQINQAIKELVDLRFIHLVNPNTSASNSDGTRYSAYMLDIGLFPNANPRDFQQVEPGQTDDKHRQDKIRSAPKLDLESINTQVEALNLPRELEVTEE
ncbi:hypothetical protein F7U70_003110 [Vibrio fluvialis]|uniref:hypothetical protein n=1 Tax=Vibrio fluvialis TaxID=676 RepID=UPI001559A12B|nr:hypothetical protein [Vibrio fluvialis]EKO3944204.1 hypothetical protein [Vibrio fluvialis]MBY7906984.1 hypothetical protein [Vibrio fluvialis]MBY8174765.1 hypothetical protein [Vibrio fluvialis]MBY8199502.1 hypothetical protein [Vibrio fluvialis]MCE7611637.1 hypothetical protein [Vibrio fluvialis]